MLAVGSVIDIKGGKFVVCGYRPFDMDESVGMGYLLVPYPLGFVNLESFSLVSSETDYPTIHEGYRNEDAASYDQLLEQVRSYGRETSVDDVLATADEVHDELEAMLAEEAGEE